MNVVAASILVFAAAVAFNSLYLGRKITMSTVTATQALTDLQNLVAALTTAIQNAAAEFSTLLQDIQNVNGVNPGAVDGLVTKGQTLVTNLNAAVTAAQAAANPPAISVAISPTTATVAPGGTQSFSATVSNDSANAGVTWAVASGGQGSVDTNGNYSVPAAAVAGTDTVTATSVTDPTKSASASVTIS
jgi:hypothetical protein